MVASLRAKLQRQLFRGHSLRIVFLSFLLTNATGPSAKGKSVEYPKFHRPLKNTRIPKQSLRCKIC